MEAEKLKDETNLFRFFLKGLTINGRVDVDKAYKKTVSSIFLEMLQGTLSDRFLSFLVLAFRGLNIKLRMSSKDSLDLLMDFLNTSNPDIPDGADLIDELGLMMDSLDFFSVSENLPFVQEFITALQAEGICDIQVGIFNSMGLAATHVRTDGLDDLYKKILEGAQ